MELMSGGIGIVEGEGGRGRVWCLLWVLGWGGSAWGDRGYYLGARRLILGLFKSLDIFRIRVPFLYVP